MAGAMLRALVDDGDVEGAIEVLARSPHTSLTGFRLSAVHDALPRTIAVARDAERPTAVRVAALESLHSFTTSDERYGTALLVQLLSDRSPDVRSAAIEAIAADAGQSPPRKGQPQKAKAILRGAWTKESDPWVKLTFVKTFEWLDTSVALLPLHDPLFAARAGRDGRLELAYDARLKEGAPGILPPDVHYAATEPGGVTHEGDLKDLKGHGFSYGMATGEARVDLPLAPGVYKVRLTATFDFHGTKIVRSAQADGLEVLPPALPDGDLIDASAPAIPPDAGASDAGTERPPRGCRGCAATDANAERSELLVPFLALGFVMSARRRSRSRRVP